MNLEEGQASFWLIWQKVQERFQIRKSKNKSSIFFNFRKIQNFDISFAQPGSVADLLNQLEEKNLVYIQNTHELEDILEKSRKELLMHKETLEKMSKSRKGGS